MKKGRRLPTVVQLYSTMCHVLCTHYVRTQRHAMKSSNYSDRRKECQQESNGNSRTVHITEAMQSSDLINADLN